MHSHWRLYLGPLVTFLTGLGLIAADRLVAPMAASVSLMFLPVLFAAYVGGLGAGLVSTAIAFVYTLILFFAWDTLPFDAATVGRLAIIAVVLPVTAALVGTLQTRARRAVAVARVKNDELLVLRTALEQVDEGVLLLDSELRILFMNRATLEIGGLAGTLSHRPEGYADLIREVASTGGYAVPKGELADYVKAREEFVRSDDPTPMEMRMANGRVIRSRRAALPDGGRMLIYSNITDLVRQAERLEELATTDGLTGLYNRRHFLLLAEAEWSRFSRHGRPMSLLILDIDLFKAINDRFGHDVGDQAIVQVAALCRENRRAADVVARIGGEEFAVLLPETDADAARGVAEQLRLRIAESPLLSNGRGPQITVSIGVAEARPGLAGVIELMKEADRALYEAKRSGRNRVVMASGDTPVLAEEAPLQPAATPASERVSN